MKTSTEVKDELYKCSSLIADCDAALLQHHVDIIMHTLLWALGDNAEEYALDYFELKERHPMFKESKYAPSELMAKQMDAYLQFSRGCNEIQR